MRSKQLLAMAIAGGLLAMLCEYCGKMLTEKEEKTHSCSDPEMEQLIAHEAQTFLNSNQARFLRFLSNRNLYKGAPNVDLP